MYGPLEPGSSLYYSDEGKGTPILFVPGWTMTSEVFAKQQAAFAKTHRVIVLDPRGQAHSDPWPAPVQARLHPRSVQQVRGGALRDRTDMQSGALQSSRYGPIAPSQTLSEVIFQASDLENPACLTYARGLRSAGGPLVGTRQEEH
jgi:pimeloyl-ACP methyl ester carboxylesterase